MEREHGPASRRNLEAFASLREAPGAGRVEEGCYEAYGTEGELQKAVHRFKSLTTKACDAPRMPSIMAKSKQGAVSTGRAVSTVEMSRGPMVSKTPPRVWSESEGAGFKGAMAMSRLERLRPQ